jgi:hypothetical protein
MNVACNSTRFHHLTKLLLGAGLGELLEDLESGARRIQPMLDGIRLGDRGADTRAESLAAHFDALSQRAMKLAKRIRLERPEAMRDD